MTIDKKTYRLSILSCIHHVLVLALALALPSRRKCRKKSINKLKEKQILKNINGSIILKEYIHIFIYGYGSRYGRKNVENKKWNFYMIIMVLRFKPSRFLLRYISRDYFIRNVVLIIRREKLSLAFFSHLYETKRN